MATAAVLKGQNIKWESPANRLKLLDPDGRLCAIGERVADNLFHPMLVLRSGVQPLQEPCLDSDRGLQEAASH
jgi:hypothetical protein